MFCKAYCSSSLYYTFYDVSEIEIEIVPEIEVIVESNCPLGVAEVECAENPCNNATCAGDPVAVCTPLYCGGCSAVFYSASGMPVSCGKEMDLLCIVELVVWCIM